MNLENNITSLARCRARPGLTLIHVIVLLVFISLMGVALMRMNATSAYTHLATAAIMKSNYLAESARDYYNHIYVPPSDDINAVFTLAEGEQFMLTVIEQQVGVKRVGATGITFKDTAFEARTTYEIDDTVPDTEDSIVLYVRANGDLDPTDGNVDDDSVYNHTGNNYNYVPAATAALYAADPEGNNPGAFIYEKGRTSRVGMDARTLSFPDHAKLFIGEEGTVSLRFRPDFLPYKATLISIGAKHVNPAFATSPSLEIDFDVQRNKKPKVRATLRSGTASNASSYSLSKEIPGNGNTVTSQWYHLVFTWKKNGFPAVGDPPESPTFYNLYLAELDGAGIPLGYPSPSSKKLTFTPYDSSEALNIGGRYVGYGHTRTGINTSANSHRDYVQTVHGFNGLIDDVALFNQALLPDQVTALYSTGSYTLPGGVTSPVLFLRAEGNLDDDGTGSALTGTVYDFDGAASTLTYGNDPNGGGAFEFVATNTDPDDIDNATRGMHVEYTNHNALKLPTAGTISIRYYPTAFAHDSYLFYKNTYRAYFDVVDANIDDEGNINQPARVRLNFRFNNWDDNTETITITPGYPTDDATGNVIAPADRQWYHFVATWDWTGFAVYHKALNDATYSVSRRNYTLLIKSSNNALFLGCERQSPRPVYDDGGNEIGTTIQPFQGWMDDIIMLNRALDQTEVEALYDASNQLTISP